MMIHVALKEAILTDDQRNEPYRLDGTLWRGDLSPPGCEAAPYQAAQST